jgi:hypothetical protein
VRRCYERDLELKEVYNRLNEMLDFELQANDNCWMAYKNASIIEKDKFGDDSLNYNFATQMDQYTNQFVLEVEKYLRALKDVANEFANSRLNPNQINE